MVPCAPPATWRELARALTGAIDRLAADDPQLAPGADLLLEVAAGLDGLHVRPLHGAASGIFVPVGPLPRVTDVLREDGEQVPCGSIDRAASKAAADMLDWHRDPDTCEVIETQRFRLYLQWPGGSPAEINQWAYGLWDE